MTEIACVTTAPTYPDDRDAIGGECQQGETNAEQHSEHPGDQAEEREQARMRCPLAQHKNPTMTASAISGTGFAAWALSVSPMLASGPE